MESHEELTIAEMGPDGLSVKRWLLVYALYLAALLVPTAILLRDLDGPWQALFAHPGEFTAVGEQALKLLVFAIYVSLACTFLPLPTGWLAAALATRDVGLTQNVWITTALVASIGAAGSVVANLHDYHLFTWVLRHRRIAQIRRTHLYHRAVQWFSRRPFSLLVAFNVLPIPIDVVRMLAATYRYPLRRFTAANFIGRWFRYAILAFVTFELGSYGWVAVLTLLAAAVILGVARAVQGIRRGPVASGGAPTGPVGGIE